MVNRGKVKGHPADSPTATDPTQPKTDQRGTKDSPLVVNTEKSGETEYEAAEKKRRDDADAVKDIGEFWLTFAIAVADYLHAAEGLRYRI